MKKLIKILLIIAGLIVLLLGLGIYALTSFMISKVEVSSVWSPDKSIVATVTETDAGATASLGYIIKVQNKNQIFSFTKEVANLNDAYRSTCASGVDLEWESDNILLIKYLEARWTNLPSEKVNIGGRVITIKLVPKINNYGARCGRME